MTEVPRCSVRVLVTSQAPEHGAPVLAAWWVLDPFFHFHSMLIGEGIFQVLKCAGGKWRLPPVEGALFSCLFLPQLAFGPGCAFPLGKGLFSAPLGPFFAVFELWRCHLGLSVSYSWEAPSTLKGWEDWETYSWFWALSCEKGLSGASEFHLRASAPLTGLGRQ